MRVMSDRRFDNRRRDACVAAVRTGLDVAIGRKIIFMHPWIFHQ
jgi:hypothetical protein